MTEKLVVKKSEITPETKIQEMQKTLDIYKSAIGSLLKAKKGEIKLNISSYESLQQILELIFGERYSNISQNLQLTFNRSSKYASCLAGTAIDGSKWFVYSQVPDYKLRQN